MNNTHIELLYNTINTQKLHSCFHEHNLYLLFKKEFESKGEPVLSKYTFETLYNIMLDLKPSYVEKKYFKNIHRRIQLYLYAFCLTESYPELINNTITTPINKLEHIYSQLLDIKQKEIKNKVSKMKQKYHTFPTILIQVINYCKHK